VGHVMQPRSPGITALAILAGLAGIAHIVGAMQAFGVLPAVGGAGAGFFVSDPIDGAIQIAAAIVTLAVAYGLWMQRSWARTAVIAIAAVHIAIIFFTQFNGGDTWWNAVPGIVLNAAILLYVRSATARPEDDR
jgi:hypothetical protein